MSNISASDEFKSQLESFLTNLTSKISDPVIINTIQTEYNTLVDLYSKLTIMTKEDLESIENDITHYENEITKLQKENESLRKSLSDMEENFKVQRTKSEMEREGLKGKIEILQSTLDDTSNKNKESETNLQRYEQTISDMKNDYSSLMTKYHTLEDEMEIYKKNIKKNFNMEKTIASLTEENEKLYNQIKNLNNSEDFKIKCLQLQSELKELNEKYSIINNSTEDLKNELTKAKTENFEKFELINSLQKDIKTKSYKIEELETRHNTLEKQLSELDHKLKEAEFNVKNSKLMHDNKTKELKKEIDKLIKSNEGLKTQNGELNEKLHSIEHYTKFAKASKENLSKKDFSLLETMSRRVEEVENLNQNLKDHVEVLSKDNQILMTKLLANEQVLFYYIKDELDVLKKRSYDIQLTKDEIDEVLRLKNNSELLMDILFTLKRDNFNLQKQIADITIECNKLLRSSQINSKSNDDK